MVNVFIKRSIVCAGLISFIVYFPMLAIDVCEHIWGIFSWGYEFFKYWFVFSLIILQFITGFIYSIFQAKPFMKIKGINVDNIFFYVIANTLLYILVILFIGNEVIGNYKDIRMVVGPAIGACLYLITLEYILKVSVNKYNYIYVIIFGLLVGSALAYMMQDTNLRGTLHYTTIPIWQVGVTIITHFKMGGNKKQIEDKSSSNNVDSVS